MVKVCNLGLLPFKILCSKLLNVISSFGTKVVLSFNAFYFWLEAQEILLLENNTIVLSPLDIRHRPREKNKNKMAVVLTGGKEFD